MVFTGDAFFVQMENRINDIQKWLSLDDETIQDWKVGGFNDFSVYKYSNISIFQAFKLYCKTRKFVAYIF
jgi:hypothetical protein